MEVDKVEYRLLKAKPRSKKLRSSIDFAAMVSVSFLLIIFFMLTMQLARPQAMDLGLPDKNPGCGGYGGCGLGQERVITLLLDDHNKVISYRGLLEVPDDAPKTSVYGKDGIRKEILNMAKKVNEYIATRNFRSNQGAIVIIKPSKKSNYGNLVDILDEMAIAKIPTYAVVDYFTPEEQKLLASN
ncbi:ExbD/TolR family protein [Flavobacterium sp.]